MGVTSLIFLSPCFSFSPLWRTNIFVWIVNSQLMTLGAFIVIMGHWLLISLNKLKVKVPNEGANTLYVNPLFALNLVRFFDKLTCLAKNSVCLVKRTIKVGKQRLSKFRTKTIILIAPNRFPRTILGFVFEFKIDFSLSALFANWEWITMLVNIRWPVGLTS